MLTPGLVNRISTMLLALMTQIIKKIKKQAITTKRMQNHIKNNIYNSHFKLLSIIHCQ